MQVQAHKDPVTGKLFDRPEDLKTFQDQQAAEAAKANRIAEIVKRLPEIRNEFTKVATVADIVPTISAIYTETLALMEELADLRGVRRTKAERKTRLELVSVRIGDVKFGPRESRTYEPNTGVYLLFDLYVSLSREPYYRFYCPEVRDLDARTLVADLEGHGGGGANQDPSDGTYNMRYSYRIALAKLPLMQQRVLDLIRLTQAQREHEDTVEKAQREARKTSAELQSVEAAYAAAEKVVDDAIAARDAISQQAQNLEDTINEAVAERHPFVQRRELNEALDGFGSMGNSTNWSGIAYYL